MKRNRVRGTGIHIERIMERYQVKTDKKSGITNDPNDWAEEVGQPRYTPLGHER